MPAPSTSAPPLNSAAGSGSQRRLVRHLDLFSGIGGFALAARWVGGIETVAFCERDEWAWSVLRKNFPRVPIHPDVKTLQGDEYGRIDLITGGYPCQPFSYSGQRRGEEDDRHLWPEVRRIIERVRPRWVLCENVTGHITMGLDAVLDDLAGCGYAAQPIIIPACAVGAYHRRDRVWILANSDSRTKGLQSRHGRSGGESGSADWATLTVAGGGRVDESKSRPVSWAPEPYVGRMAHGLPSRVDRLRGLGNAIVPQVAAEILRAMMAADCMTNS